MLTTSNKQCQITLRAAPLPNEVTSLLENNNELIKMIDKLWSSKNRASILNSSRTVDQSLGKFTGHKRILRTRRLNLNKTKLFNLIFLQKTTKMKVVHQISKTYCQRRLCRKLNILNPN